MSEYLTPPRRWAYSGWNEKPRHSATPGGIQQIQSAQPGGGFLELWTARQQVRFLPGAPFFEYER